MLNLMILITKKSQNESEGTFCQICMVTTYSNFIQHDTLTYSVDILLLSCILVSGVETTALVVSTVGGTSDLFLVNMSHNDGPLMVQICHSTLRMY